MLELVNLSNDPSDTDGLLGGSRARLQGFLHRHNLAGIEFMCCAPWDRSFHAPEMIRGFHLWFWPNWLDFWLGDEEALLREYGSQEKIELYFGTSRQAWLAKWQANFRQAAECGAEYAVFHVTQARNSEIRCRRFAHSSAQVIEAVLEFINQLAELLPPKLTLLYENLWWQGLTLLEPDLVRQLLQYTRHDCGIMLDTGHLMNTNLELRNEHEAVEYVLKVVDGLGELSDKIYGIHLHQSLSGKFVQAERQKHPLLEFGISAQELMDYVLRVDQHQPFATAEVRRIVEAVCPHWLVHEFVPTDFADWEAKLAKQQKALHGL